MEKFNLEEILKKANEGKSGEPKKVKVTIEVDGKVEEVIEGKGILGFINTEDEVICPWMGSFNFTDHINLLECLKAMQEKVIQSLADKTSPTQVLEMITKIAEAYEYIK